LLEIYFVKALDRGYKITAEDAKDLLLVCTLLYRRNFFLKIFNSILSLEIEKKNSYTD